MFYYHEACSLLEQYGIDMIRADCDAEIKQSLTLYARTAVNLYVKSVGGMEMIKVTLRVLTMIGKRPPRPGPGKRRGPLLPVTL